MKMYKIVNRVNSELISCRVHNHLKKVYEKDGEFLLVDECMAFSSLDGVRTFLDIHGFSGDLIYEAECASCEPINVVGYTNILDKIYNTYYKIMKIPFLYKTPAPYDTYLCKNLKLTKEVKNVYV